jgi:integrase
MNDVTEGKIELLKKIIPWNKGKAIGQRPPLKQCEIWSIRTRLELSKNIRELALFNLAIDSKLRGIDLTQIKVNDISNGYEIFKRAKVVQQKTHQSVQFELTSQTRSSVFDWIKMIGLQAGDFLFPSRNKNSEHIGVRQYSRIVKRWVKMIGLEPSAYGTHSLRRTKATLIYKKTKNLRAIQLLLGHKKIESTVRYLGVEVEDALEMAEQTEA